MHCHWKRPPKMSWWPHTAVANITMSRDLAVRLLPSSDISGAHRQATLPTPDNLESNRAHQSRRRAGCQDGSAQHHSGCHWHFGLQRKGSCRLQHVHLSAERRPKRALPHSRRGFLPPGHCQDTRPAARTWTHISRKCGQLTGPSRSKWDSCALPKVATGAARALGPARCRTISDSAAGRSRQKAVTTFQIRRFSAFLAAVVEKEQTSPAFV